jgi:hypothetical protein
MVERKHTFPSAQIADKWSKDVTNTSVCRIAEQVEASWNDASVECLTQS